MRSISSIKMIIAFVDTILRVLDDATFDDEMMRFPESAARRTPPAEHAPRKKMRVRRSRHEQASWQLGSILPHISTPNALIITSDDDFS